MYMSTYQRAAYQNLTAVKRDYSRDFSNFYNELAATLTKPTRKCPDDPSLEVMNSVESAVVMGYFAFVEFLQDHFKSAISVVMNDPNSPYHISVAMYDMVYTTLEAEVKNLQEKFKATGDQSIQEYLTTAETHFNKFQEEYGGLKDLTRMEAMFREAAAKSLNAAFNNGKVFRDKVSQSDLCIRNEGNYELDIQVPIYFNDFIAKCVATYSSKAEALYRKYSSSLPGFYSAPYFGAEDRAFLTKSLLTAMLGNISDPLQAIDTVIPLPAKAKDPKTLVDYTQLLKQAIESETDLKNPLNRFSLNEKDTGVVNTFSTAVKSLRVVSPACIRPSRTITVDYEKVFNQVETLDPDQVISINTQVGERYKDSLSRHRGESMKLYISVELNAKYLEYVFDRDFKDIDPELLVLFLHAYKKIVISSSGKSESKGKGKGKGKNEEESESKSLSGLKKLKINPLWDLPPPKDIVAELHPADAYGNVQHDITGYLYYIPDLDTSENLKALKDNIRADFVDGKDIRSNFEDKFGEGSRHIYLPRSFIVFSSGIQVDQAATQARLSKLGISAPLDEDGNLIIDSFHGIRLKDGREQKNANKIILLDKNYRKFTFQDAASHQVTLDIARFQTPSIKAYHNIFDGSVLRDSIYKTDNLTHLMSQTHWEGFKVTIDPNAYAIDTLQSLGIPPAQAKSGLAGSLYAKLVESAGVINEASSFEAILMQVSTVKEVVEDVIRNFDTYRITQISKTTLNAADDDIKTVSVTGRDDLLNHLRNYSDELDDFKFIDINKEGITLGSNKMYIPFLKYMWKILHDKFTQISAFISQGNTRNENFLIFVATLAALTSFNNGTVKGRNDFLKEVRTIIDRNNTKDIDVHTASLTPIKGFKEGNNLLPHQITPVKALEKDPEFAFLGVAAGGGKTLINTLHVADAMGRGVISKPIIMCPSDLLTNYVEEFAHFTEYYNPVVLNTESYNKIIDQFKKQAEKSFPNADADTLEAETLNLFRKYLEELPPNSVLLIDVNFFSAKVESKTDIIYGTESVTVYNFANLIGASYKPDMLIIDESHLLKNKDTERASAVRQLASACKYKRIATGTLVSDKIVDMLGQISVLDSAILGHSTKFEALYFEQGEDGKKKKKIIKKFRDGAKKEVWKNINNFMSTTLVSRIEWYSLLPPFNRNFHVVGGLPDSPISAAGGTISPREAYNVLISGLQASIKDFEDDDTAKSEEEKEAKEKANDAFLERTLHTIETFLSDYSAFPTIISSEIQSNFQETKDALGDANVLALIPTPKMAKVIDLIHSHTESGDKSKIFIVTQNVPAKEATFRVLDSVFPGQFVMEDGSPTRASVITQFKTNPSVLGLIGTSKTLGTGHNFQIASRLILLEVPWSPGDLEQVEARIRRPDPKSSNNTRTQLNVDIIMTEDTMDVPKVGRLISKVISTTKFMESDNHNYDFIADLEPFRLSIKNLNKISNSDIFEQYKTEHDKLIYAEEKSAEDFKKTSKYRETNMAIPAAPFEGAELADYVPYNKRWALPRESELPVVKYKDFVENKKNWDHAEQFDSTDTAFIEFDSTQKYVHTEYGDGVVTKVLKDQLDVFIGGEIYRVDKMASFIIETEEDIHPNYIKEKISKMTGIPIKTSDIAVGAASRALEEPAKPEVKGITPRGKKKIASPPGNLPPANLPTPTSESVSTVETVETVVDAVNPDFDSLDDLDNNSTYQNTTVVPGETPKPAVRNIVKEEPGTRKLEGGSCVLIDIPVGSGDSEIYPGIVIGFPLIMGIRKIRVAYKNAPQDWNAKIDGKLRYSVEKPDDSVSWLDLNPPSNHSKHGIMGFVKRNLCRQAGRRTEPLKPESLAHKGDIAVWADTENWLHPSMYPVDSTPLVEGEVQIQDPTQAPRSMVRGERVVLSDTDDSYYYGTITKITEVNGQYLAQIQCDDETTCNIPIGYAGEGKSCVVGFIPEHRVNAGEIPLSQLLDHIDRAQWIAPELVEKLHQFAPEPRQEPVYRDTAILNQQDVITVGSEEIIPVRERVGENQVDLNIVLVRSIIHAGISINDPNLSALGDIEGYYNTATTGRYVRIPINKSGKEFIKTILAHCADECKPAWELISSQSNLRELRAKKGARRNMVLLEGKRWNRTTAPEGKILVTPYQIDGKLFAVTYGKQPASAVTAIKPPIGNWRPYSGDFLIPLNKPSDWDRLLEFLAEKDIFVVNPDENELRKDIKPI